MLGRIWPFTRLMSEPTRSNGSRSLALALFLRRHIMTGDLEGLENTLLERMAKGIPVNRFLCFGGVPMLAVAAHYRQV